MSFENVNNGFSQPTFDQSANALFLGGDLVPSGVFYGIANNGADTATIRLLMLDGNGAIVTKPILFNLWLSDDVAGAGITGITASSTAVISIGNTFDTIIASKLFLAQTNSNGEAIVQIIDNADTPFVVAIANPITGLTLVARPLVATDYNP